MRAKRKKICLIGVFALLIVINIHAEISRLTYRGWEDCYKITNDSLEIIVNASSGGRILVVKKHGVNFMWEDNTIDGKDFDDYQAHHFHPDAGRFDFGPEKTTSSIHDMSWAGPWDAEIIDDYSLQISNRDEGLGLLSHRKFTLDPVHPYLKISLTMENITSSEKQYWFWGRTLLKLGGKIFSPLNPGSDYPDRWTRYIWGNPVTFASDPADPGVNIVDSLFTLVPGFAGNSKYGTDAETGWMAYGYKGMIFAKTFAYFDGEPYLEDNNHTHIFYAAHSGNFQFVEMEPVSPAVRLQPGENYSFEENWYVFDHQETTETSFDPLNAADVLFANFMRLETVETGFNNEKLFESIRVSMLPGEQIIKCSMDLAYALNLKIRLVNIQGMRVVSQNIQCRDYGKHEAIIDISGLSKGMYFIEFIFPGSSRKKIVKKVMII